jgi:hypothetical protein
VTTVALQNVKVDTTFATAPESFIGCKFIKRYRTVTKFKVHFHYGSAGG